jgi:hypothetical protein
MEHRFVGVSPPPFSVCGISAEHVIVSQKMIIPKVLGGLSIVSDGFRVGAYLGLRKSHTYLHA